MDIASSAHSNTYSSSTQSNMQSNIITLNRERQERPGACQSCAKVAHCPASGRPDAAGVAGQPMQRVMKAGKAVFEAGSKFEGIYVARSGFFKSYTIDAEGAMQVTGFYLPGEFFGMDGIEDGTHKEYVEALDTSSVCRVPLEALCGESVGTEGQDATQRAWSAHMMLGLVKLMGRTISRDHDMFFALGKMTAKGRLGAFLADLSRRMALGGFSATEFRLCMSRTDIANYLCLALETVSRLFTQLQLEGALEVDRRNLRIKNLHTLLHDDTLPQAPLRRQAG
ncbi:MAG: helix-turn-helix domain-containing protein [Pseudomonadales bacterium]|jgi:CRP/FNR family transcriptional regulator|nr:helix-turn-helix domain-containing protein [Pseudomonadales bacterium]